MTTSAVSTGSNSLNAISSSYVQSQEEEEDPLGREAFLTMLVAQLQNQDPLNPMEGTDFSSQLAQYSSLEAQLETNDTLEAIQAALASGSQSGGSSAEYLGKEIVGAIDSMEVSGGEPFGGYFSLDTDAEVMVAIYDADGEEVRSLYPGQKSAGMHAVDWDGNDNSGNPVLDGTYTYAVYARDASGNYSKIETTVNGVVDGIVYNDGVGYLKVNDTLVHPDSVREIVNSTASSSSSPVDCIGQTIEADAALLAVRNGSLAAGDCEFSLKAQDEVDVVIYDSTGQPVRNIFSGTLEEGFHSIEWDGNTSDGYTAPDGMYSYGVITRGAGVETTISGEVDGVVYDNGVAYLSIDGRMVNPAALSRVGFGSIF